MNSQAAGVAGQRGSGSQQREQPRRQPRSLHGAPAASARCVSDRLRLTRAYSGLTRAQHSPPPRKPPGLSAVPVRGPAGDWRARRRQSAGRPSVTSPVRTITQRPMSRLVAFSTPSPSNDPIQIDQPRTESFTSTDNDSRLQKRLSTSPTIAEHFIMCNQTSTPDRFLVNNLILIRTRVGEIDGFISNCGSRCSTLVTLC